MKKSVKSTSLISENLIDKKDYNPNEDGQPQYTILKMNKIIEDE